MTLNNLGAVYRDTGRLADADNAYSEAVTIYRDLAAHDPAYRPDFATTLNNLGSLYWKTGRLADADKTFSEALTIYRDLASRNPTYAGKIATLIEMLSALRGKSSPPSPANPALPATSSLHKKGPSLRRRVIAGESSAA
jgi:tetratricopeptide (TPR) repeat protein